MPLFTPTPGETLRWEEGAPQDEANKKNHGEEIEGAEQTIEQTHTEKETDPLCIFKEVESRESLKLEPALRDEAAILK